MLRAELRSLQSTLNTLKAAPTATSLLETVASLEVEIQGLETRLKPLRASPTKLVSAEEKAAIIAEHSKLQKLYRDRKKQFREFWGTICEGCVDSNPSDLWVSDHAGPSLSLVGISPCWPPFSTPWI